jgi:hypothetical protein
MISESKVQASDYQGADFRISEYQGAEFRILRRRWCT